MTRDFPFRSSDVTDRPDARPRDDSGSGNENDTPRPPARERSPHWEPAARRPDAPSKAAGPSASDVSPPDTVKHLPERQQPAPFREAALFYDPPYESPLADRLAWRLVRHLKPSCGLQHETVALTPRNCFRLDFLIEAGDDVRGIERAGLLIGERPEAEGAPALYDALIAGSEAVDVLYRFAPEGLAAHLGDALALMHQHDPALFERDKRLRASQGPCAGTMQGAETRLSYPTPPVEVMPGRLPQRPADPPDLVMRRLSAAAPAAWAEDYRRALDHFRVPAAERPSPEALQQRAKAA